MQYLDYDRNKIKWNGKSPVNKTFLIAPMAPDSALMIFNASGDLLVKKETDGYPAYFVQLDDLSGYIYSAGKTRVNDQMPQGSGFCANGNYTIGKLYITDNNLETKKVVDYIPTEMTKNALGIHMHGSYVLGENHYLLQIISMADVVINDKPSYVVNCIIQEQLNGEVIWEWQTIDDPKLFEASFECNTFFDKAVQEKKYASDYAHMNSVIKTSDGKYMYISLKHIGIVKLDYETKKVVWIAGTNKKTSLKFPDKILPFAHQHDLHLIDDNTIYFWDNKHFCYTEMGVVDNKIVHYKTLKYPTRCNLAVMGNVIRVNENIMDVCYGLRMPPLPHIYMQPIIAEFDLTTGKKLMDLTIRDYSDQLVNAVYQVNRGVNIYEN